MKLGMKMRFNEPLKIGDFMPQMIELHLSDEDLEVHRKEIIDRFSILPGIPIVVHTPTNLHLNVERRPLVDISTVREKQRDLSLRTIEKTIDLMGEVGGEYVVIHPGSQTSEKVMGNEGFMKRLLISLEMLEEDYNTRELLMENMPWHYWMWGGEERWYSNVLQTPEDFLPVLEFTNVTLDICHAYLAVPEGSDEMIFDFIEKLGGYIKHVHLSDAAVPDKEGLQFGEGDIELRRVFRRILDMNVTVIPEIRGGHLNDREGLQEAISRYNDILLGRFEDTKVHAPGEENPGKPKKP